ncbi:MAG TPA: DUF2911 domain-containing protein [Gemmatimonadaceae bacterium]|nr:DUF2911 domain-containing protein [Gemmatimonadaceae bacterium]
MFVPRITLLSLMLGLTATANAFAQRTSPLDSAVFVTRLGSDTLVIERVVRSPQRVEAEVAMRVPRTTRTVYVLQLSPSGMLERMEATTFDTTGGGATPARREIITRVGDSLRIETTAGEQRRTRAVRAEPHALPFIDMVHWPYEIALVRLKTSGATDASQPLLTGSRVSSFALARVGVDSMTITHPSRGTMRLRVDSAGRLMALDAGATTRKLVVERRPWMPIDDLVKRWTAQDAAGRSLGALSGRARSSNVVAGATIGLDHGTPSKRGRRIWGALVPFGTLWRTGANEATHFETDRDLVFGTGGDTLVVPAGRYTLFSVPEREGGWLIINRETGQAGTAHDPAQDLGRVRLSTRPLRTPVETFTIKAETEGGANLLRLQWDDAERVAPFRVRQTK